MKKIEAYIQPFMLQKVTDALHEIHVHGMSVAEIKGFGKEKDESFPHHSRDYIRDFTPKVKIEIICLDAHAEEIVGVIQKHAHTGRRGDGKILIYNVEQAVSILTGERGKAAI